MTDTRDERDALVRNLLSNRIRLRDALLALGVPDDEVAAAEQGGTLELLALEQAASVEPADLDLLEVAARSGVEPAQIRALWRALGFPDPRPGQKVFTETDVEMLSAVVQFIEEGALESDLALQLSRVIGSAMNRVATAMVDATESQVTARREAGMAGADADAALMDGADVLPLMPRIIDLVWRRHLAGVARRRIMRATTDEGETVCVGFADLVGFTAQTQELPEHQLAEVVGRFETISYDLTAAHHGRVVKMIGDEVMFVTDDIRAGAALVLDLAGTFRDDPALSDVRVGLASGRVLERDADLFGPVVNLASRIVNVAFPGAVVVSRDVHDALTDDDRFVFRSLRSHYLKDIGRVPLWALRSAEDESAAPYEHERHKRAARFANLVPADLLDSTLGSAEDPTTSEMQAITDAVLGADIDTDLQVELLADVEATRKLQGVEDEANLKVEAAMREAEEKSRQALEDADRKVSQALKQAERKRAQAKRDARRKAKRKTERNKREKTKADKPDKPDKPDKKRS